jgi:zinc protease
MKKIYLNLFLALFCMASVAVAQVDRTKAPEAGPAPKIQIGDYQSFELSNGLKVFVVENHKVPKISFQLTLDRDPIREYDKAGNAQIAGELLRSGTTNRDKAKLDEEVDFIGATLSTSSTGIYASALSKHRNKVLELMSDVLLNPAFPQDELDKIKKQMISSLATEKDNPDAIARNLRVTVNYGKDHPYGEIVTEESVEKITVQDVRNYYNTNMKPNASYLVIVGDIELREAKKLVKNYFAGWKKGEVPSYTYKTPQAPSKPQIAVVNKTGAVQSVINVTYPIMLKPGDQDAIKASVTNTILGGTFSSRLSQNLREDKAYTYGSYSNLSTDKLIGEFTASAKVRTDVTDSAVAEFIYEMERMRKEPVSEEELNRTISQMTGSFARSLESPQTVARFALNIERYDLPQDYYATYLEQVSEVQPKDVQQMAQKYITPANANIVVVGNAKEIGSKLERFGQVTYYDMYGNKVEPASADLPSDVNAEQVLANYIRALGGARKLQSVNDVQIHMQAAFQGMNMDMEVAMKAPNKSATIVKVNGMEMQKEVFDGEKAVAVARGQVVPRNEQQTKDVAIKSMMWPELVYDKLGVKTSLIGVEHIDNKEAYGVEVVYPTGTTSIHYFDKNSGLKVREAVTVQSPQGEMTITTDMRDYKAVNGVLFPHTTIIPVGPQKLEAKVTNILVNKGVADDKFQVQ